MPIRMKGYSLPVQSNTNKASSKDGIQWRLSNPKYQLNDLILDEATMTQLYDVISYFRNKDLLLYTWGLSERYAERSGLTVNLYGESGTGKTMAAHAIANALKKKMILVDYAEIESKYVGETAKNLTALFHTAMNNDAVIFFDEADALLSKRVTNMSSATDVSVNQTRSVLLTLMNEYHGVILFATNFLQNFDQAFMRRIQYHIHFELPGISQREALWKQYIPARMPCHVDYAHLSKEYKGITGSDIANAVFTAAVRTARNQEKTVSQASLEKAIQNIIDSKYAHNRQLVRVCTGDVPEETKNHNRPEYRNGDAEL